MMERCAELKGFYTTEKELGFITYVGLSSNSLVIAGYVLSFLMEYG